MTIESKVTRFRAYQLGNAGSSFSYFNGNQFTLIEARYNETNAPSIDSEMEICGVTELSVLHITSWDQDHCAASQLEDIIEKLKPKKIQYPGYSPHSENGKTCLSIINNFKKNRTAVAVTPEYIDGLNKSEDYGYKDILYHPKFLSDDSANDNSTVKLFRSGSVNVLSLGDVESTQISSGIKSYRSIKNEVDVMILAHHGADNGFTTSSFLKAVRPQIAIASADYANQFAHPKQAIRDLLHKNKIQLFTTKTGDVVIFSTGSHTGDYRLDNLKSGSSDVSSSYDFTSKKKHYLGVNQDTLRDRINRNNRGPRR